MDMLDFFKGIVDTEEGPIVISDLDYKIIYLNPTAQTHYVKAGEMLGKHLDTFLDEEIYQGADRVCGHSRTPAKTRQRIPQELHHIPQPVP